MKPRQALTLMVRRSNGDTEKVRTTLRLTAPAEIDYVRHGGIMSCVLSEIMRQPTAVAA